MTYPVTITAQLLDYDGTPVVGNPLLNSYRVNWYDEENGPGRGGCSLQISDPGSAELLPGRYVNCIGNGTVRFTFKIQGNPKYEIIEVGEELRQSITVTGLGWACDMDEAITYPEYAQNFVANTTWRLFSFASELFPNAGGWGAAIEMAEYLEGVTTANCYGHAQVAPDGLQYPAPIGFPWPTNPYNLELGVPTANYVDSYWIRTDNQPNYASAGYWFFRNEFVLTEFTPVTFTVTGDNFFTLFLEGVPILGEEIDKADGWTWQGWYQHQMWLPAGTYTIAAAVYNISFTDLDGGPIMQPACPAEGWAGGLRDDNPGGLLFVAYVDGGFSGAPDHILSSNSSWTSYYELDTWPGWTPGQIIAQLISEGVARGSMANYNSDTFADFTDSNGDAWRPIEPTVDRPDIPTLAVPIGNTLMQALSLMQEKGYINWHMQPGTQILDVYRGRRPIAPVPDAVLAYQVNLVAYELNATAPYANALMVQWEGGYMVVEDAAAIAAYGGRVEDFYQSNAATEGDAILEGETELIRRAQSAYPAIVAGVEPVNAADCPYEGFTIGGYVEVPGGDIVRCLSIACNQDDLGYAQWTCELNAKLLVPEREQDNLLKQIGGRNQVVRGVVR